MKPDRKYFYLHYNENNVIVLFLYELPPSPLQYVITGEFHYFD